MRLHVAVIGAEQLPEPVDGQLLGHVHVLAAAVVALALVAFCVLVCELADLGLHHPRAGVVLARDQLDVVFLALALGGHGMGQFGVVGLDAGVAGEHRAAPGGAMGRTGIVRRLARSRLTLARSQGNGRRRGARGHSPLLNS